MTETTYEEAKALMSSVDSRIRVILLDVNGQRQLWGQSTKGWYAHVNYCDPLTILQCLALKRELDEQAAKPIHAIALSLVCECGSGSNLLGPAHSSWCRCLREG